MRKRSKENLRKYICKLTFWLQRLKSKTFTLNLPPLLKNSDINEIKGALVLKDIISETTCVCVLVTKFHVSSIILTCFRRGNFTPHPHSSPPQKKPLKSPSKIYFFILSLMLIITEQILFTVKNNNKMLIDVDTLFKNPIEKRIKTSYKLYTAYMSSYQVSMF